MKQWRQQNAKKTCCSRIIETENTLLYAEMKRRRQMMNSYKLEKDNIIKEVKTLFRLKKKYITTKLII